MRSSHRHAGFSILELIVIVVLLAALAATVTPRFAAAGDRALRGALREQVESINRSVDAYRRDNAGQAPALGGEGATGWAPLIEGRYLAKAPVNAYLGLSSVESTREPPALLGPEQSPQSAGVGWFYHPLRGVVVANGFDHLRDRFHDEPGCVPGSFAW